jgi:hypothetical protein
VDSEGGDAGAALLLLAAGLLLACRGCAARVHGVRCGHDLPLQGEAVHLRRDQQGSAFRLPGGCCCCRRGHEAVWLQPTLLVLLGGSSSCPVLLAGHGGAPPQVCGHSRQAGEEVGHGRGLQGGCREVGAVGQWLGLLRLMLRSLLLPSQLCGV